MVVDGETGLLVPIEQAGGDSFEPVDPARFSHDLATAINRLLADAPLRERMAVAGRRRVEELFSWGAIAQKTVDLYESLIRGRVRPAG